MQLKNNLFIVLFFVTSARETIKEGEPLVDLKTRELHEQLLSEVPWHNAMMKHASASKGV